MSRISRLAPALLLAVGSLAACGGGGGTDDEKVTLRWAEINTADHYIAKGFTDVLVDEAHRLAEEAGYDLEIKVFPDSQLGDAPDQVTNLNNGVFDMATVGSPYMADQMPMGNVFSLPMMGESTEVSSLAYYDESMDESSVIHQVDFEANEMLPLGTYALPAYQVTTTFPFDRFDDETIKGKPIRSSGGVQDNIVKILGGSPVALTQPEQYEGLQRKTVEGGLFNLPSLISNKTHEVLTHFTTNANVSGFNAAVTISRPVWDRLPEWAQEILIEAGLKATRDFAAETDETNAQTITDLVDEHGLTAVELDSAQLDALRKKLVPAEEYWVNEVPAQSENRKKALQEAKAAIDELSK